MLVKYIDPKPQSQPARRGELARFIDITIVVRPIGHGRFEAKHAGRVLIAFSREPFCAAARALLAEGFAPGLTLGMRHEGADDFSLRGRLGAVAKVTVADNGQGTPKLQRWTPPPGVKQTPPVRSSAKTAPTPPGGQTASLGVAP